MFLNDYYCLSGPENIKNERNLSRMVQKGSPGPENRNYISTATALPQEHPAKNKALWVACAHGPSQEQEGSKRPSDQ